MLIVVGPIAQAVLPTKGVLPTVTARARRVMALCGSVPHPLARMATKMAMKRTQTVAVQLAALAPLVNIVAVHLIAPATSATQQVICAKCLNATTWY